MPAAKAAGAIESSRMFLLPILLALRATEADAALIVRLQRHDPQALADLYDRYGRLAYSLILRVVRDTGVAEDLVQETFLRVWNRAQGLDADRGSVGAWLLAVARNPAIDYQRSTTGRARNTLEMDATDHPALYSDMEKDLLQSDKARRVKAAMEKLSDRKSTRLNSSHLGISYAV